MGKIAKAAGVTVGAAAVVAARDVTQKRHAILRTYPVIGHLRFLMERFGPELRQYIVTSNDEERPFSRDQRRWIYASSKLENNYFGFGTDNDVEHANGYPILKHRTFKGEGAPTARHAGDEVSPAVRQGARRPARAAARVPPRQRREHLRHELRLAVEERDRGAQPRGRDGRLPARHRRGCAVAVPPQRRRPRLPDRDVVLRVPRRAGRVRRWRGSPTCAPARRSRRSRSSCRRAPSPASAACSPGPRSPRRSPRSAASSRASTAPRPAGTRPSTTSTRCSTSSSWSRPRPGCPSASSRPSGRWACGTS